MQVLCTALIILMLIVNVNGFGFSIGRKITSTLMHKSIPKLLYIRGGVRIIDQAAEVILTNRVADAVEVLGLIKVPAALFAGASLSSLYIGDVKKACPELKLAYVTLTSLSFALHVCTVFCSSILSWRLMGGGFNGVAESAAALLVKYFELEYLAVGSFFFAGIICFFMANTVRAYIEYGNSKEAVACSAIDGVSTFFLVNFFDFAMVYYDSFAHFLGRFLFLLVRDVLSLSKLTIRSVLYFVCTMGFAFLVSHQSAKFARSTKPNDEKQKNKNDEI